MSSIKSQDSSEKGEVGSFGGLELAAGDERIKSEFGGANPSTAAPKKFGSSGRVSFFLGGWWRLCIRLVGQVPCTNTEVLWFWQRSLPRICTQPSAIPPVLWMEMGPETADLQTNMRYFPTNLFDAPGQSNVILEYLYTITAVTRQTILRD